MSKRKQIYLSKKSAAGGILGENGQTQSCQAFTVFAKLQAAMYAATVLRNTCTRLNRQML